MRIWIEDLEKYLYVIQTGISATGLVTACLKGTEVTQPMSKAPREDIRAITYPVSHPTSCHITRTWYLFLIEHHSLQCLSS